jgi:hypothetical protein
MNEVFLSISGGSEECRFTVVAAQMGVQNVVATLHREVVLI